MAELVPTKLDCVKTKGSKKNKVVNATAILFGISLQIFGNGGYSILQDIDNI